MIQPGGPVEQQGLGWLRDLGSENEIVLSSRVRVARNLQGFPFPGRAGVEDRTDVLDQVSTGLNGVESLDGARLWEIESLKAGDSEMLVERHLISRVLSEDAKPEVRARAVVVADAEPCGVIVNEEDHLRIQALAGGFELSSAWQKVDSLDEEIGALLPFAYHHQFGFLTACPTNVGTGLRASALVHLPGLVLTKEISKVLEGISQVGLTYRGLYGEGSEVVGNLFQISNQTTLGKSEEDLIDHLVRVGSKVIEYERSARILLLREAPSILEDKVWRAYGILRNARSLTFGESMNLLSGVRLGMSLKLLKSPRVETLNEILIFGQTAHLERAAGGTLDEPEADVYRATYVRQRLADDERGVEGPLSGDGSTDATAAEGPSPGG